MGAALSILVLLSLSIFIVRGAAVALRLTGLEESSARFQALSAFTGTGFTTREAEAIVNYPLRRRIVSLLMIVGNIGLISLFATLVASLVKTDGEIGAVMVQMAWMAGGLALLWFLMLNKMADRTMCAFIGKTLEATTFLGQRNYQRLLQIADGFSVCEHSVDPEWLSRENKLSESDLAALDLTVLALRSSHGEISADQTFSEHIKIGDSLLLFGSDTGHDALSVKQFGSRN